MLEPLRVNRRELNTTVRDLPASFRSVLGHPPHEPLNFKAMPTTGRIQPYALSGRDEDSAIDLRGGQKPVVPVAETGGRFHLAVGFDWYRETESRFRFVRLQMLAFVRSDFGSDETRPRLDYQQVFRLEWEGTDAEGTFEAPDVGHPHWQIDVFSEREPSIGIPSLETAVDLDEAQAATTVQDNSWLQRMHLAALTDWDGEAWPQPYQTGRHARLPRSLSGLTGWMLSACAYVQHELSR